MKTFLHKWRPLGMQVFIYLDDILILGPAPNILQKHLALAVKDLIASGFKINQKKSVLHPTQVVTHLGFQINLLEGKLQLHPAKVKCIRHDL